MLALCATIQKKKRRGYCDAFNAVIKGNVCSLRDGAHVAREAWMPPRYMYQLLFIF
jgi:hypothetical protein